MLSYLYNLIMGTNEENIETCEEVVLEQSLTPHSMEKLPENKVN